MNIIQRILRYLSPADPAYKADAVRKEVKSERAERTEKAIERYGAMLNSSASDRRGRPHSLER